MHKLELRHGSLTIAPSLAEKLGRPYLGGTVIGELNCSAAVDELEARMQQRARRNAVPPAGGNVQLHIEQVQAIGRETGTATNLLLATQIVLSNATAAEVDLDAFGRDLLVQIAWNGTTGICRYPFQFRHRGQPWSDARTVPPGCSGVFTIADAMRQGDPIRFPESACNVDLPLEVTVSAGPIRESELFGPSRDDTLWFFEGPLQPNLPPGVRPTPRPATHRAD